MFQMMENLSKIKKFSKEWDRNQRVLDQKELNEVEQKIQNIYISNNTGVFSEKELEELRTKKKETKPLLIIGRENQ